MQYAAAYRSEFMWPWETVPHSLAHGIVDDETYDWVAVVEAMLMTGGQALVVNEDEIAQANGVGVEATGIDVDATGSAGLAGLAQLCRRGLIGHDEPRSRAVHRSSSLIRPGSQYPRRSITSGWRCHPFSTFTNSSR